MTEPRFFPDEHFRMAAGKAIGVSSITLGLYAILILPAVGLAEVLIQDFILHSALPAIGFGIFALVAVPRQPFNNSVWVAVWAGLISGISVAGYATMFPVVVSSGVESNADAIGAVTPAELPPVAAVLYSFVGLALLAIILILCVGLLLFPDGQLPSSRWRWVAWGSMVTSILFAGAIAHEFRPSSNTPLGSGSGQWTGGGRFVDDISLIAVGLSLASLLSLGLRYRGSVGLERQQYRWMGLGCGMFIIVLLVLVLKPGPFVQNLGEGTTTWTLTLLGFGAILTVYGIAVGRYRLYDVDVVISRAFVYGSLAAFITAVYIVTVVGFGFLQGGDEGASPWLGIAATVVVAIGFQPLRRRLQKVANRMVYGRRSTPYEVLSSFSQSVAAVDPRVLEEVARSLTEGTTATAVSIWVNRASGFDRIASWPDKESHTDDSPHGDYFEYVTHDGERLGAVRLDLPPGHPLPPNDEELVGRVVAGLGLALRNLQLTADLQERVDQLRESRRRVVALQDQTRQMLERDLHDGAQQRLVALKIKVGLGGAMAERQELGDVKQILDTVRGEADLTIESLRDLARGIYPPLLEAEGLSAALTAQLRRAPLPVAVQAAGVGRYPREIEATVYFCVLEAVQNAIKHARAKSIAVAVDDDEGHLSFDVRDDGIGFDTTVRRNGLLNMADRLDVVGGALEIVSSRGHGAVVSGRIPISEAALT